MKENKYEKLLNINTLGERLWDERIKHYHPYQATTYECLNILFKDYELDEDDFVVDFGCGKGRLNFYINYLYNSNTTGIEMDKDYYNDCLENKKRYIKTNKKGKYKINFENCLAQDYKIKAIENKFYFFNPFSVQIFRKIVNNILESIYEYKREVEIILYYPSDDYIYFLENETPFVLKKQIKLDHMYSKDVQECFLIYKICYLDRL